MAQQPFISTPLDIPDVRVLKTELAKAGELILTVGKHVDQHHLSALWAHPNRGAWA